MGRNLSILMLLALLVLPALDAQSHVISKSHSTWDFSETGASVEFRIPLDEVALLPAGMDPESYWSSHLTLTAGGESCPPSSVIRLTSTAAGWAVYRWQVECSGDEPLTIRSDLLQGLVAQHIHLAQVLGDEAKPREKVLVGSNPQWNPDGPVGTGTSLAGYFFLGVEHILGGWDHLAFVMALVLLVGSFKEVLKLVTGFTIAHSLTLGLAALGLLRPDTAAVEIMIGFSIALVAAENNWWLGGRGRVVPLAMTGVLLVAGGLALAGSGLLGPVAWFGLALFTYCHFGLLDRTGKGPFLRGIIAFAFGLIHGFGFGGALMEIGLPSDRIVPALLGFNVGVEIGQLLVVALVFPLLKLVNRVSRPVGLLVTEWSSAGIFAVGIYWVLTRNWWTGG